MGHLEEGLHPSETPLCGKHDDSQTKDGSPKDIGESPSSASKEEIEAAVDSVQSSFSHLAIEKTDLELCKTSAPSWPNLKKDVETDDDSGLSSDSGGVARKERNTEVYKSSLSFKMNWPNLKKDVETDDDSGLSSDSGGVARKERNTEVYKSSLSFKMKRTSKKDVETDDDSVHGPLQQHMPIMSLHQSPPLRPDFKKDSWLFRPHREGSFKDHTEASDDSDQSSYSGRIVESYKDDSKAYEDSRRSAYDHPVQQQSMSNISANPHALIMFPPPPPPPSTQQSISTRQATRLCDRRLRTFSLPLLQLNFKKDVETADDSVRSAGSGRPMFRKDVGIKDDAIFSFISGPEPWQRNVRRSSSMPPQVLLTLDPA